MSRSNAAVIARASSRFLFGREVADQVSDMVYGHSREVVQRYDQLMLETVGFVYTNLG